ncbi:isotrichodermin C-15 hydroxylase [Colletotrichum paranaense]|uniref:Isotrichodermin C-15 hydroxylase n=1 Tax=Colletotrichum paranaense TaxID=1914294 RepID=A0ABQ9SYU7_9PEZI|nr:isotrichodermin C-15 hydroxylase [Colletotrichum paranaense]KAK1544664.1 isotrichodermin C-15 hydroxylase [Colletotrichum paranaense]
MAGVLSILSEHPSHILAIAFGTAVLWQLLQAGYNLFLHPLRRFPGPVLQRASPLIWAWQHATGYQAFRTQLLHDRYGPIVRISPNHLSFTDVTAWKDIYGFQIGKELAENEIPKSQLFSTTIKNLPMSIINAEREEHQRYRRALSHGFSDSSMRAQEGIIMKYIDKLISRLHENCDGKEAPLNVEAWYNWTTFDIAGDLIFAQSFGCLDRSDYHPWIAFIFKTIRYNAIMTAMKYIGLDPVVQGLFRIGGLAAMMQLPNGLILVLAGSETTATTLAGTTYLLLRDTKVLQKLNEEVRSSFNDSSEITINSVSKLSYMLAVLNEALRMYPPVTSNLIREVPEFGCQIGAEHVPQGTFIEIQQWSANHSPDNWTKPWEFRPERFLETNKEEHNHLDALQAFSVGPRNCIGKNLAYAEMRLILARIVFDFDLQLAEGNGSWIQRQRAFGLWDRIPLNVYLKPVAREARV